MGSAETAAALFFEKDLKERDRLAGILTSMNEAGQELFIKIRSQQNELNGRVRIACSEKAQSRKDNFLYKEFDPGSGRTLAACLTHASRTECY